MTIDTSDTRGKVALVTGAARRIGAVIARTLHGDGINIVLHYRSSEDEARRLRDELNAIRADSAMLLQADLCCTTECDDLLIKALDGWGRLDVLVNNASAFFPTPVGTVTESQWNNLMDSNLKAPFFLSQAAAAALARQQGCIINITDIHADRPLKDYGVYCMAKAGLVMMTRSLARELGPAIRVNAVAPGAILWPEDPLDADTRAHILSRTALKRQGNPLDIARAVLFLARDADYITGQVITVDGGRSVHG